MFCEVGQLSARGLPLTWEEGRSQPCSWGSRSNMQGTARGTGPQAGPTGARSRGKGRAPPRAEIPEEAVQTTSRPVWALGHVHSVPESSDPCRSAWVGPAHTAPPPRGGSLRAESGARLNPPEGGQTPVSKVPRADPGPTQVASLLGVPDFPVLSLTIGTPSPQGAARGGQGPSPRGPPTASHKVPPTEWGTRALGSAHRTVSPGSSSSTTSQGAAHPEGLTRGLHTPRSAPAPGTMLQGRGGWVRGTQVSSRALLLLA